MKTLATISFTILIITAFVGGFFFGRKQSTVIPPHLTLEQILSIRELHLVKHTYNDLFFLHRKNNPAKPIRAIVHIPVTVTAFINLKEIQLIKQGDSVKQIILPKAKMNEPQYQVDQMVLRETRSFQIHVGKDQYSMVGNYLQDILAQRVDSVKQMAITHRILKQAELEAKEYIEELLKVVGRSDITVKFIDDFHPTKKLVSTKVSSKAIETALIETSHFGFLPI